MGKQYTSVSIKGDKKLVEALGEIARQRKEKIGDLVYLAVMEKFQLELASHGIFFGLDGAQKFQSDLPRDDSSEIEE